MDFTINEQDVKNYVLERFSEKYPSEDFESLWAEYNELKKFKINENIFDFNDNYNDKLHYILRLTSQYFMVKVFDAMKVEQDDPNVAEDLSMGNIGTAGRIVKMWTGANTHDDRELMSGRFHEPVRLAKFPNEKRDNIPIIKEVDLTAVCSHHFAPFSTLFSNEARVRIAYIPGDFVIGISKLQRVVRQIAQRGWLQEDLTKKLYNAIMEATQTEDVYVQLKNIKHSCEFLRGAMTQSNGFTTEYYGGQFKSNPELLKMVKE